MNKKTNTVEKIIEIIDSIRPYINMDGGDLEFIKYEDGYVYVKLTGACKECGFADETINYGLSNTIKSEIDEVKGVINIDI